MNIKKKKLPKNIYIYFGQLFKNNVCLLQFKNMIIYVFVYIKVNLYQKFKND